MRSQRTILSTGQARPHHRARRGSTLIVALGVLAMLSVMAVHFVAQMRLEKVASGNYVDGVKARLIAEGALQRSLEEMRQEVTASLYSTRDNIYGDGDFWLPLEVSSDVIKPGAVDRYRPSMVGVLGQSYQGGADRYKIKVIDAQSQFNLNTTHNPLIMRMMLETLGAALADRVTSMNATIEAAAAARKLDDFRDLLYPEGDPISRCEYPRLTEEEKQAGANVVRGVDAILELRKTKEGEQFQSKSELLECMSQEDYRFVRDFVTAKSWFDPKAVETRGTSFQSAARKGDVMGHVVNKFLDGTSAQSDPVRRAPLNVNLATWPTLMTALAPVAGRRVYVHARFESQAQLDQNTNHPDNLSGHLEPVKVTGDYTKDDAADKVGYGVRRYLVYFPPLGYRKLTADSVSLTSHCRSIVTAIDTRRRTEPFKSMQDWDEFVEETLYGLLPTVNEAKPHIVRINNTGGSARVTEGSALYNEITAAPGFLDWFKRSYVGILRSNFNPNGRFSQMNPDQAVYVEVDKGNLRYLAGEIDQSSTTVNTDLSENEFQTMEWCFGSKGVFEIVALGELVINVPAAVLVSLGLLDANSPQLAATDRKTLVRAQDKLRSVIQIYDQVVHTSQNDFLRNGQPGQGTMPGNIGFYGYPRADGDDEAARFNMTTYPVDERRWLPDEVPVASVSPPYRASEYGGLNKTEHSDLADGYLQLKPQYYTEIDQQDGVSPVGVSYDAHFNQFDSGQRPLTQFELRMDYRRRRTTVSGPPALVNNNGLGNLDRLALLTADVAGGAPMAGPNQICPPNGFYANPPTSSFAVPLPPASAANRSKYGPYWLSTNSFADPIARWLNDFAYPDGYYSGDDRRNTIRDLGLTFLTYRAQHDDAGPLGSPAGTAPGIETRQQARGTGGAQPWSENPNMHANRGAVSFWYKPSFDWVSIEAGGNKRRSERYCGFFASTHVAEPEVTSAAAPAGASSGTDTSFRGTQMYAMRATNGALRVTRMYFEVAGADATSAADIAEMPKVRNPWLNHPRDTAPSATGKEFLTVDEYKQAASNYYDQISKDIAAGTDILDPTYPTTKAPPYYPWPPREMFLPQNENDSSISTAERRVIDQQLSADKIRAGRYDTWVDPLNVPELKAHNWYHLTVVWDDALSHCRIFVDNEEVGAQSFVRGTESFDAYDWSSKNPIEEPTINLPDQTTGVNTVSIDEPLPNVRRPTFVRLNTVADPFLMGGLRDEFSIGGFNRVQRREGSGVFKHRKDASLPANGTVDDFVVYGLPNNNTVGSGGLPNMTGLLPQGKPRFFEEGGWSQRFDLSDIYDASEKPIRILGAYFDAYLPSQLVSSGSGRSLIYDNGASVRVEFALQDAKLPYGVGLYQGESELGSMELWRSNGGALEAPTVDFGEGADLPKDKVLSYRVSMTAGVQQRGGNLTLNGASTPIFDSLTVVYQLPKRRVLVKERVFD